MYYDKFKKNMYSQNGEDGVLEVIINELGLQFQNMWVVDCGAFDGISYSNVRKLIENECSAVMIEPALVGGECEPKYIELKNLPNKFPKVVTLNHFTKISNSTKSDSGYSSCKYIHDTCKILNFNPEKKTLDESLDVVKDIPIDYDILNIDIDSYDHDVWKEHTRIPKIVIIEIESTLHPIITDFSQGYSFADSIEVGNKKGYGCVCHTGNMIYVRNDLLNKLSISKELINSTKLFNTGWIR